MFDLSEQVAVVTGAARGIGRRIAESFRQSGARVICADFADWGDRLEPIGENLWGIRLDVTDPGRVKGRIRQDRHFGQQCRNHTGWAPDPDER